LPRASVALAYHPAGTTASATTASGGTAAATSGWSRPFLGRRGAAVKKLACQLSHPGFPGEIFRSVHRRQLGLLGVRLIGHWSMRPAQSRWPRRTWRRLRQDKSRWPTRTWRRIRRVLVWIHSVLLPCVSPKKLRVSRRWEFFLFTLRLQLFWKQAASDEKSFHCAAGETCGVPACARVPDNELGSADRFGSGSYARTSKTARSERKRRVIPVGNRSQRQHANQARRLAVAEDIRAHGRGPTQ